MSGKEASKDCAQNCSREAPGPMLVHFSPSILETLSKALPMLSSGVVASMRNDVRDVARRSRVCPPDMSRVRNGNLGGFGRDVRKGVRAWAC